MYMDWHGWGMGGGWLFMVIFWGVVSVAIIAVAAAIAKKTVSVNRSESAIDILKKRYAKGEITKQEYDNMRKDIGGP